MRLLSKEQFSNIADVAWGDDPEEYYDPEDLYGYLVYNYGLAGCSEQEFCQLYKDYEVRLFVMKPLPKLLATFGLFLEESFAWTSKNIHTVVEFEAPEIPAHLQEKTFNVVLRMNVNTNLDLITFSDRLAFALSNSEITDADGYSIAILGKVEKI